MEEHFQHCADFLKKHDFARYISCLFYEEELRKAAFALFAFHHKIREIPLLISEPMPGEIRIQWWRDLNANPENISPDPMGRAFQEVISKHQLPQERLDNLLQAHIFDLYNDPMPDLGALEAYLGETYSSLLVLLIQVSNQQPADNEQTPEVAKKTADACGHAGVLIGLSELVKLLPFHMHTQRRYFPEPYGPAADVEKSDQLDVFSSKVQNLLDLANHHHKAALEAIAHLPEHNKIIFNYLFLAHSDLERTLSNLKSWSDVPQQTSRLKIMWQLWRARSKLSRL